MKEGNGPKLDKARAEGSTVGNVLNMIKLPGGILIVLKIIIFVIEKIIEYLNDGDED